MVKTKAAEIDGKDLYFFQATSQEELKKEKIPDGLFFYWEYDGRRIFNPGEIIGMILDSCETGKFSAANVITPKNLKIHYKKIMEAQQGIIRDALDQQQKDYDSAASKMPSEYREQLDASIKNMRELFVDGDAFPDINGMFQPTQNQAEKMLGKDIFDKIYKNYTEDDMKKVFKDETV